VKLIKVAAAVLNQTPLDWNANAAHILAALKAAKAANVSVLCLPELCICGYGCEDAFFGAGVRRMSRRVLQEIAPHTAGLIVTIGLPVLHQGALFNALAVLVDGQLVGFVAKRYLAGDGLHYEPRWFKPWPAGECDDFDLEGTDYPIGDLVVEAGGVRIGFEICEDAWAAARPGRSMAGQGVDVILNPSASHYAFGKGDIRRRLVLEGSRAFGVTYVYGNLLGNEAGRAIYDGDAMIATAGRMIAQGPRFGFEDVYLTAAVVDLDLTRMTRATLSSYEPAIDPRHESLVEVDFAWPAQTLEKQHIEPAAWEQSGALEEEQFTRVMALGLFDYLRKSRSAGYVVSLSGGADSSAVACLVRLMIDFGVGELGIERFKQKLGHIRFDGGGGGKGADDHAALARTLLTTVYQATRNSSEVTRHAARAVAEAAGSTHHEFDVDALVDDYVAMVSGAIGRELTWDRDDLTLQNIQARARGPGAWMLANLENKLLAATSNRSEAAVGYATMDGDTCGGISPIAGIDKAFLRRWLRWLEQTGPAGLGPIPALAAVNAQQPTAELRPAASGQTDEADLMPYDLLDAIEDAAIGEKRTPVEVFEHVRVEFEQYTPAQLAAWIERFFKLWSRNQWKRERYAPSFHVDDKNLDPKTWCRFPILSGGFERELEELRERVRGE